MAEGETLLQIEAPQSSFGAPLPHLFADEERLVVAYLVDTPHPDFNGTNPRSVRPTDEGNQTAILIVELCKAFQFGPPNDEAIAGHRLYPMGLKPYSAFEVLNSSWIDGLEKANRVHSGHRPEWFASYRHFIFTFHDSTLEFVAENFSTTLRRGSPRSLIIAAINGSVSA